MQQGIAIPDNELTILSAENAQIIARFFQVLSDPTRVRLVKALADGKWCVSDLVDALEMDQPAVSHQLKYLRKLGMVTWERTGRHIYYTLDDTLLRATLLTILDNMPNSVTRT
ncbi:MAG: metalloregulator ArsR/SmtB family transcription factor [Phototrophicaceae bacterium]